MKGLIILVGLLFATSGWAAGGSLGSDGVWTQTIDAHLTIIQPLAVNCHTATLEFGEIALGDIQFNSSGVITTSPSLGAHYSAVAPAGFTCDVTGEGSKIILMTGTCDGTGTVQFPATFADPATTAYMLVEYPNQGQLVGGAYSFDVEGALYPGNGFNSLAHVGSQTDSDFCNILIAYQ
jgi:hypothetical protein